MDYAFKNFEEDLRVALNHFYDPIYAHLVEKIASTLGCASQADAVQEAIKSGHRRDKACKLCTCQRKKLAECISYCMTDTSNG